MYFSIEDYSTSQTKEADTFKFNLNKLYNTICKIPNTDEVTLLLYMLLHRNSSVKHEIMRRPDIQLLASDCKMHSSLLVYIIMSNI